ncbi:polysaccharide deacetylase family protein [Pontibacillus yanchengensis]|uniref:Polysaccharide deacetylase family protein n=1 Tax=Pontibacillus yanchengensis TaxID=462910 RepID=A0ACC7VKR7_9BACI|nr:polysaccharide deacetylase family protein [Pontibacillus yanchengensis]MYL54796.1 polysaccharide deacetylase family protein [Pontibacillus yanchengensis]
MRKLINSLLMTFIGVFLLVFSLYHLMNAQTYQVAGKLITDVDTDAKVVALTFDGGPTEITENILVSLEKYKVQATFFLNGSTIMKYPEQLKNIVQTNHQIGNQSYSYEKMIFKSPSWVKHEIETTDQLIRDAGYEGTIPFRPPYGKKLFVLPFYLQQQERDTVMWSIEPKIYADIDSEPESIIQDVSSSVKPGSIISLEVMYESNEQYTIETIEGIIEKLSAKGYSFTTVSKLMTYQK